jgi:hypothetical protein
MIATMLGFGVIDVCDGRLWYSCCEAEIYVLNPKRVRHVRLFHPKCKYVQRAAPCTPSAIN